MRGGRCVVPAEFMWSLKIHGVSMHLCQREMVIRMKLYSPDTEGPVTRETGGSEYLKIASKLAEPASAMQSRYLVDNNADVIIFQI